MTTTTTTTTTTSPYHEGERAVQALGGLVDQAEASGRAIRSVLPPPAVPFLGDQPMLIVGAADADGRMWASALSGDPGFIEVVDDHTLQVVAHPPGPDPLAAALRAGPTPIGTIAIEPATRRRMRINGRAQPVAGGIRLDIDQVYSNCPKYIQKRAPQPLEAAPSPTRATITTALLADQQELVATADTFFVATRSAEGDADASHRGGSPGFLQVLSPSHLRWPDYIGNAMMMTLGNLEQDPAAGLLLLDWRTGTTLQLTGRAVVDWSADAAEAFPGAQRVVDFQIAEVIQVERALPLTWSAPESSRFNPPPPQSPRPAA